MPQLTTNHPCPDLLVDIVAVDGVDVVLHDPVAVLLGDPGGDVAQVMDHTRLVVEQLVRDEAAAIRDVEMTILNPCAQKD